MATAMSSSEQCDTDIDALRAHFSRGLRRLRENARVLLPGFDAYVRYEARAIGIRCFAPQVVPGLLQTEDYMRGLTDPAAPAETLDARVAGRLERQAILTRDDPPIMRLPHRGVRAATAGVTAGSVSRSSCCERIHRDTRDLWRSLLLGRPVIKVRDLLARVNRLGGR